MPFLATECPVAIRCVDPNVDYHVTPQPTVPLWLAAAIVLALLVFALALNLLRERL
jgi:hypothetical protein